MRAPLASAVILGAATLGAQDVTEIRQLGTTNSFCGYHIDNARELAAFFDEYRSDIEAVLREAGWTGDPRALFSAVAEGRVSEVRVPVGASLAWMAVRRNGRPRVIERVRWAGREAFEAFEIRVPSGCVEHRVLIPKSCGNLSLVELRSAPTPATPALGLQAASRCAGEWVTADVTPVGNAGEGATMQLTLQRPGGSQELLTLTPTATGLRWRGVLDQAGTYALTAIAVNACDASAPVTQEITLEPCVPSCRLRLLPPEDGRLEPGRSSVRIDLSESRAERGALTSASVAIYHEGRLVEDVRLDPEPYETAWVLPEYGRYEFVGRVQDERGAVSRNGCSAAFAFQEPPRRGPGILATAFVGLERRWRPVEPVEGIPIEAIEDESAPLVGGTAGVVFPVSEGFAFFGQFGGAVNLETTEHSSLFADFGGDLFFGSGFLGAGIGYWDFSHEETRDGSLLVHGGLDTPWSIGGATVQWFVEGRLFLDMLDMIENNYVGMTGFRFVVKP